MLDNLLRGAFCGLIVAFWGVMILCAGIFIADQGFINDAEYGKIAMVMLLACGVTFWLIKLIGDVWTGKSA